MNRNQTKLLVESWRNLLNEVQVPGSEYSNQELNKFVDEVAVQDYVHLHSGLSSSGSNIKNPLYNRMWDCFWKDFSSKKNWPMMRSADVDNAVQMFFQSLSSTYNKFENKAFFDKVFKSLSMHKEENLVLTPFKLLFSDFMHNMRGGAEGYAWESDEDANKMKKNFYAFLEELKRKGFSDRGECLYFKR